MKQSKVIKIMKHHPRHERNMQFQSLTRIVSSFIKRRRRKLDQRNKSSLTFDLKVTLCSPFTDISWCTSVKLKNKTFTQVDHAVSSFILCFIFETAGMFGGQWHTQTVRHLFYFLFFLCKYSCFSFHVRFDRWVFLGNFNTVLVI